MLRRLIVNADDFGLTPGVSRGILSAHRHGIVTSSTALVTGTIDRDPFDLARDEGLPLGLHVNLTLGAPLTRARSLIDGTGRLVRDAQVAASRGTSKDVEAEVAAQIEKFLSLARIAPTHLDSHHHVGLYSPVREALLGAAVKLGVPVRSQNDGVRAAVRALGLRTPDHFFGESGPDAYWSLARTLAHLRDLPPGISEFMAHPGLFDDALAFSRYGRQRETELVGLGSSAARAGAMALGITLCDFRMLAGIPPA